jgi:hypothetical protein
MYPTMPPAKASMDALPDFGRLSNRLFCLNPLKPLLNPIYVLFQRVLSQDIA